MLSVSKLVYMAVGICVALLQPALSKDNNCYRVVYVNTTSSGRPPEYLFTLHTTSDGNIHTVTTVNQEIAAPIMRMQLTQHDANGEVETLFNVSAKLCDFLQVINQVHMFQEITKNSLRRGNYSFNCPMRRGVYVLNNLRINSRNPLISFMYKPKRIITFKGGMSEELPNKEILELSHFAVVLRIAKKSCQLDVPTKAYHSL